MELPGEKLVIKLWETLVERGMGSLLSPWQAGREGRVRNEIRRAEMLMLAQAEVDVADIRSGKKQLQSDGSLLLKNGLNEISPINERVEPFFALSLAVESGKKNEFSAAARSEINSSKAIIFAEEQLAADGHIPSEKGIEEDWLFIWREHAGRVSSVDLQRLWGSVLAGELKDPGKHSIRTLEFLKTLSKADAELISSLARYVVDNRIQRVSGDYLATKGISFTTLLEAQDLGVLSGVDTGVLSTYKSIKEDKFFAALISHNKAIIVEHTEPSKELQMPCYLLTAVGRQVLGLGSFEPDLDYLRVVGRNFVEQGFTVKIADWVGMPGGGGKYFNAKLLD